MTARRRVVELRDVEVLAVERRREVGGRRAQQRGGRGNRGFVSEDREAADAQILEVEALAAAEREPDGAADAEDLLVRAVERHLNAER